MGLVGGTPTYMPIEGFVVPDVPARTYHYNPDGRLFAYALPTVVRMFLAEGAQLLQELSVPNIIELKFSPRGTYLSTWEQPVKLEDSAQHKNLRIFSATSSSRSHKSCRRTETFSTPCLSRMPFVLLLRRSRSTVLEWGKCIADKLRVEGASMVSLSPGLNHPLRFYSSQGAPAVVKIYGLPTLSSAPTCSQTFYKADRAQIKWNDLGTQALVLTQTEVDNSDMSYYGETGMYLLSAADDFDCRVTWTRRDRSMTSRGA
ncbi:eIF2A-domain-containing protein [Suillus hirtellus]|nr:eIF2A-domain-containing protein [Suillus hirtellus]